MIENIIYVNDNHSTVLHEEQDTVYITFPKLDAYKDDMIHGFSTRKGGVSQGYLGAMNLSFTRGDDRENVLENHRRFAQTLGYDEKKLVKYPYNLLDELELAYAITIHKAQGSEYPAVIIPLLQGPRQLYYRNLLYTAVTRARKCVTVIGSESVFQEMIHNTNQQNRNTSLVERIRELNES